jgi:hypothetical protein
MNTNEPRHNAADTPILETSQPEKVVADPQQATKLLTTLFEPNDIVLYRPVESWIEGKRKQSRVDYRNTCHHAATPELIKLVVQQLVDLAARDRTNLYFGVCPRFGGKGQYDLAWQIRIVRALWVDIDHCKVAEALERVSNAKLPRPSAIVNSGNGVHMYWLLEKPYLIDDVGDPPAVLKEFVQQKDGRKKPRKYISEDDERVYLDQQRNLSELSPKAEQLQGIIAGLAKALGGDHTQDLSRMLRIPGTFNCKNQRNGQLPVATSLIECDSSRRFPIGDFEHLFVESEASHRRTVAKKLQLPSNKPLNARRTDKLNERIAASAVAEVGLRSQADFAVCCHAIRDGVDKEEVWVRVCDVGKFGESGRGYFERTWSKAEQTVRLQMFEQHRTQQRTQAIDVSDDSATIVGTEDPADGPPTIVVDPSITPVAKTLAETTGILLATNHCYQRAQQLVVVQQDTITSVIDPNQLAGLLSQHVEYYFATVKGGSYKPLPANYGNTWLHNLEERNRFPRIQLYTRNPVYTPQWELVEPGYHKASEIYYAGEPIPCRDSTDYLDELLRDFCFRSPCDRTNYLAMLLTTITMPMFIGAKPAVLFAGNQPGLGKTILAQIIAILRDGCPTVTASYNPNDEEFEKRLGAVVRQGSNTIIIDNAKTRGRSTRIESACLERSITDPLLSFRLLGQSQEIRVENSHIFCITANTPEISRDLVTRSCVVNLEYEGNPERRCFAITDPEEYALRHRTELLGELIGMVERWKRSGRPLANCQSRFNKRGWATTIGGILQSCREPDFLMNAEEASTSFDETRRDFDVLVQEMASKEQSDWLPKDLVKLCDRHGLLTNDLGEGSARSQATKMGVIAGRFLNDPFYLGNGTTVKLTRVEARKGNAYRLVPFAEVPNLRANAEPCRTLEFAQVRQS